MTIRDTLLRQIPVDQLQRGAYQPRHDFDQAALEELAISIQEQGVIQPLVVRALAQQRFEIVAGERRWRAAQLAGLHEVPCLVRSYTNEDAAEVAAIENIQRQDLNPIEEAKAYQRLAEEFCYLHEEIAAAVGKSRTKITNSLRLLKLDSRVQQLLIEKKLNEGHGKVLAGLVDELQHELAMQCINKGWSVRRLEQEAKKYRNKPITAIKTYHDPNIARLERITSEQLGSEVKLETDRQTASGWIKIKYYNNDTLAGLLDKMGIDYES